MLFQSSALHQDTVHILTERYGSVFERLYPPQIEALVGGLLSDKNMVISFPTATGKTLLAEICFLEFFHTNPQKKMLYLSPLKALSAEKFQDFKYLEKAGMKVRLSTGDYDQQDLDWQNIDLLITTNEKLDALIRNNPHRFRDDIGLVVVDEIHLLDDFTRGPTLEVAIVKLRMLNNLIKVLALSATISNAEELAQWLNATLVQTSWRSIAILEGITLPGQLSWFPHNKDVQSIPIPSKNTLEFLIEDTIKDGGQVLIFTSNRKKTEQLSQKIKDVVNPYLSSREHTLLENSLLSFQESETKDPAMDLLELLIPCGVAFHHAGLSSQPRELIESLYRDRLLKVIIATPTLAAGINLPARRVIIESIWRYSELSSHLEPIKVMEYEQMRGRCGRPQYDTRGEAIILVKNQQELDLVKNRYLSNKGSEAIRSKLATENSLRMHILGAVTSGIINSYSSLLEFINNTLYGFQYGNESSLESKIINMLKFLSNAGFIRTNDEVIEITALGRRVANLYIDPLSAYRLLTGIIQALNRPSEEWLMFSFLHLFCTVPDLHRLRMRKNDWDNVKKIAYQVVSYVFTKDSSSTNNMDERFLSEVYTAESFRLWIEETDLTTILEKTKISLGDFHRIIDLGSWISYSTVELVKELYQLRNYSETYFMYFDTIDEKISAGKEFSLQDRFQKLINYLKSLEIRFKYGIKEDLLPLINLKYIGRTRARILANNGIFLDKLSVMTVEELSAYPTFGPTIAKAILEQVRQTEPFTPTKVEPQANLPTTFAVSSPTSSTRKNTLPKSKQKQRQINDFL